MKKISFMIMIALLFLSLFGCDSNKETITVKNGDYVMEQEEVDSILLPHITISDNQIMFVFDLLSSYLPIGTYTIKDDILTMTTDDNQYIFVFQIDGDNLVFQKEESSPVGLIDRRLGVKINDQAKFHRKDD